MDTSDRGALIFPSQRTVVAVVVALVFAAVFAFLPYEMHRIIWSNIAPPDTLIRGTGFPSMAVTSVGVTAAVSFGAAGLCAAAFLERMRLGLAEYSRRYGAPRGGLYYPWKIDRINFFIFWIGPVSALLMVWYMFDGYEISDRSIYSRAGPLDTCHQYSWLEVRGLDLYCYRVRSGLLESIDISVGSKKIDLGETVFDEYGDTVTSKAKMLAGIVSKYGIRQINVYQDRECHSPDINAILGSAGSLNSRQQ